MIDWVRYTIAIIAATILLGLMFACLLVAIGMPILNRKYNREFEDWKREQMVKK